MKTDKKINRITVRLTPKEDFALDVISEQLDFSKAVIVRYAIDKLIEEYKDVV